jgi:hypothetical protein
VLYAQCSSSVMLIDLVMWLDLHQGPEERTFINSDRLSPEGLESEPYELKLDDIDVGLQLYSYSLF